MNQTTIQKTILGSALPNIPWEDRPEGYSDVLWRSKRNPVIRRNLIPSSNSIFNSAVVPYKDGFAGVFRCDDRRRYMQLHSGKSPDGLNWTIRNERLQFRPANERAAEINEFFYGYDPRVCWIASVYGKRCARSRRESVLS